MNNFLQMCYSGDLKKIQEHLQSDISILNQTSLTGESPLHIAVKRNNIQLCIILLEKKIDYNAKNFVGLTPLMMSCKYKNPAVTKLLLQQDSIQVNTKDISGKTAPMYAVESNCVSCINLLTLCWLGFFRSFRHKWCSSSTVEISKTFLTLGCRGHWCDQI